jgi:hypothetical protein
MIKLIKLTAGIAALCASTLVQAKNYDDETLFFSGYGQMVFPNLDLSQPNKARLTVSDSLTSPEKQLDSLTLEFANANNLAVSNFKQIGPNMYRAVVNDAWVFSRVFVEVSDLNFQDHGNFMVRLSVADITSLVNDAQFSGGIELFNGNGLLRDVTPRAVADSSNFVLDDKQLTLTLMDRLGSEFMNPTPGFEQGFEVKAAWLGHGNKTFYIPAPVGQPDFGRFTAVGFHVESFPGPEETEYLVSIRYVDDFGGQMESGAQPLRQIIDQVYGPQP